MTLDEFVTTLSLVLGTMTPGGAGMTSPYTLLRVRTKNDCGSRD
jgi:hypothetical protein